MKNICKILFLSFILCLTIIYRHDIQDFITENFIYKKETPIITPNRYALQYEYNYIQTTNDFNAKNKQHVLNIVYTYLNSGISNFYFFCDYKDCKKDIAELTQNNEFAVINNFLAPYNTYNKLYVSISPWGKIEMSIDKAYTDNEIAIVEEEMHKIANDIIKSKMSNTDKIKAFHDYIIDHTKYDQDYLNNNYNDLSNPSHRAIGTLLYHKALCGGYAHSMSIFLNMLNIPNYRISSKSHIWNLVYIDGKWLHLDLTWDDPSTTTGKDVLLHDYYLITTTKLQNYNTGYHDFDVHIYSEASILY